MPDKTDLDEMPSQGQTGGPKTEPRWPMDPAKMGVRDPDPIPCHHGMKSGRTQGLNGVSKARLNDDSKG
jgi:hypothetical protein